MDAEPRVIEDSCPDKRQDVWVKLAADERGLREVGQDLDASPEECGCSYPRQDDSRPDASCLKDRDDRPHRENGRDTHNDMYVTAEEYCRKRRAAENGVHS